MIVNTPWQTRANILKHRWRAGVVERSYETKYAEYYFIIMLMYAKIFIHQLAKNLMGQDW